MVIPFTYNILKRHPALMYMINRIDEVEEPGAREAGASEWLRLT